MVYLVYSETGLRLFNTQKIGGGGRNFPYTYNTKQKKSNIPEWLISKNSKDVLRDDKILYFI